MNRALRKAAMHYTVKGDVDERAIEQLVRCADEGEVVGAALCADGHVGYSQPIGGVVAYRDCISPSGVGYDIGCGNKAVRTNLRVDDVVGAVGQRPPGGTRAGRLKRTKGENVGLDAGSKEHQDGRSDSLRPKNEASLHAYSGPRSESIARIMDEIVARISFGMGRVNDEPVDHAVFDRIREAPFAPQRQLLDLAARQLGTVGAGNHYVDLFSDEDGWLWVGVHFGSRGFGHKTASGFLALAQGKAFGEQAKDGEMDSPPILFHVNSGLGQSYIEAMTLAGEYAYAGRDVVVDKVLEILGAKAVWEVHNHHNFAWWETHHGEEAWVVRKGCTPAWPGQEGFVGATMGEPSVILEGIDSEDSASLLYSTVHGAGRVMSRTQAAGKMGNRAECNNRDCNFWVSWKQYRHEREQAGKQDDRIPFTLCPDHPNGTMLKRRGRVKDGLIDYAQVRADLAPHIEIRGGAADEAPAAYKRLDQVLAAHEGTIRILQTLTPVGVAMAGPDVYDPFKD
jgi:tRNA-splicing ligase RtcB